jgi:L-rhamnose mutarotase
MDKMEADPETQRWWDVVKPLMEPMSSGNEGEFWANMEEVFHLDQKIIIKNSKWEKQPSM